MTSPGKITVDDLIAALETAGVLEAFLRLPKADQENFSRWIGTARDDASHWRRIEAFVSALEESPLKPRQSMTARFDRAAFK